MAVPAYLQEIYSVTDRQTADVADLITDFGTAAVAAGWTDNTGGSYTCPSDSGRTFTVIFTRTSAQVLSVLLKDQSSNTVYDRRALIDTGGPTTSCKVLVGTYGFYIDIWRQGATDQSFAYANMVDPTPESKGSMTLYVHGHTAYDSTSALTANNFVTGSFMYENAAATAAARTSIMTGTVGTAGPAWAGGTLVFPAWVYGNISATQYLLGRQPGVLMIWGTPPFWSQWLLPIDTGTVGTFMVVRRASATVGDARMALRIA